MQTQGCQHPPEKHYDEPAESANALRTGSSEGELKASRHERRMRYLQALQAEGEPGDLYARAAMPLPWGAMAKGGQEVGVGEDRTQTHGIHNERR